MKQIVLAAVPQGMPKPSDFRFEELPDPPCPVDGILLRTRWISVDPYLRGMMTGIRSYTSAFKVGDVISSGCVGEVVASKSARFKPGQLVSGNWGWQDVAALGDRMVQPLLPEHQPESTALGILGMPGLTAYFGLREICRPKPGETVFVTGAAGAVGSYVGQIAKALGCYVAGAAGSPQKVSWLGEIGFDTAFNYKDGEYDKALTDACPRGVDCFFDNVGGELSDVVFRQMNTFGRVAICGHIATYNDRSSDIGPRLYGPILVKQLRVEGFIVTRWLEQYPQGIAQLAQWYHSGRLQNRETVYEGFDSVPRAFIGLFNGENTGKAVVKV